MPKAPMYENHSRIAAQNDVRTTGKMSGMQAIAQTVRIEKSADDHFRLRISIADRSHDPTADFTVKSVCHIMAP